MAKFNGHQEHVILTALELYKEQLKAEIADMEAKGKRPFMTQGFVDMDVNEIAELVKSLTYKKK